MVQHFCFQSNHNERNRNEKILKNVDRLDPDGPIRRRRKGDQTGSTLLLLEQQQKVEGIPGKFFSLFSLVQTLQLFSFHQIRLRWRRRRTGQRKMMVLELISMCPGFILMSPIMTTHLTKKPRRWVCDPDPDIGNSV